MAIAVANQFTAAGTGTSAAASSGTSSTNGNLLVALVYSKENDAITLPASWYSLAAGHASTYGGYLLCAARVKDVGAATSYTFAVTSGPYAVQIYELSGADLTALDITVGTVKTQTSAATSWTSISAIDPTYNNSLGLTFVCGDSSAGTTISSTTFDGTYTTDTQVKSTYDAWIQPFYSLSANLNNGTNYGLTAITLGTANEGIAINIAVPPAPTPAGSIVNRFTGTADATSVTASSGTSSTNGNLLVGLVTSSASSTAITLPQGWYPIQLTTGEAASYLLCAAKVSDIGEATSYTFTVDSSAISCAAFIYELSDADQSLEYIAFGTRKSITSPTTAWTSIPQVTPSAATSISYQIVTFFCGITATTPGSILIAAQYSPGPPFIEDSLASGSYDCWIQAFYSSALVTSGNAGISSATFGTASAGIAINVGIPTSPPVIENYIVNEFSGAGSGTTVTASSGTSSTSGNQLVAFVRSNANIAISLPANWTSLAAGQNATEGAYLLCWANVATVGAATSYTFTVDTSAVPCAAHIYEIELPEGTPTNGTVEVQTAVDLTLATVTPSMSSQVITWVSGVTNPQTFVKVGSQDQGPFIPDVQVTDTTHAIWIQPFYGTNVVASGASGIVTADLAVSNSVTSVNVVVPAGPQTSSATTTASAIVRISATTTASGSAIVASSINTNASANVVSGSTGTQTANASAVLQAQATASVTAKAIVLAKATQTAIASATVQAKVAISAGTSAIVRAVVTSTANAKAVVASSLTAAASAIVKATQTITTSASGIIQALASITAGGSAIVRAQASEAVGASGIIRATTSQTTGAYALIRAVASLTAAASGIVASYATAGASGLVQAHGSATAGASATVVTTGIGNAYANAQATVLGKNTQTAGASGIVASSKSTTASAIIQEKGQEQSGASAIVREESLLTADGSAVVRISSTQTADGSAIVRVSTFKTAGASAVVVETATHSTTASATVLAQSTKSTNAGALIASSKTANASATVEGTDLIATSASAVVIQTQTIGANASAVVVTAPKELIYLTTPLSSQAALFMPISTESLVNEPLAETVLVTLPIEQEISLDMPIASVIPLATPLGVN
jgi:hypothetical protein